jgi:hypothetical protein
LLIFIHILRKENSTRGFQRSADRKSQNSPVTKNRDDGVVTKKSEFREPHISLTRVNELLKCQPYMIILELSDRTFGFDQYLNSKTMGKQLIDAFIQLMSIALTVNSMGAQKRILAEKFVESNFLREHVYNALMEKTQLGEFKIDLIRNVLNLIKQLIETCPKRTHFVDPVKERLELIIKYRMANNKELLEEFEKLNRVDSSRTQNSRNAQSMPFLNYNSHLIEPPDDFAQMNIVPKLEDIVCNQEPFLRKNITNGAYKNVDHYLDVQFRLLREDFLRPLRIGVMEIRTKVEEMRQNGTERNFHYSILS